MRIPEKLQKGDTILLIAPAKRIEQEYVDFATQFLEKEGYKVEVSENCLGQHNYFSGTEEERKADLQWAINHPTAKAVLCARGGYGSVQNVENLDWSYFENRPKWWIGFSDITVFHQKLAKNKIASLHATMPLNFQDNSEEALQSLLDAIENKPIYYSWETAFSNIPGTAQGEVIGGNLTVLCSLIGTSLQPDYKGKILFIEDVGEALYAIDRSLYQLELAGILDQFTGVVVGDFSGIKATDPAYELSLHDVVLLHFVGKNIPVAFDFPGGHCDDNRTVPFGLPTQLTVYTESASLVFEG